MSTPTVTFVQGADAEQVAAYHVRIAKLRPSCSRCGKTLGKRETGAGRCADREECRVRQTFRSADGNGRPGVTEWRALQRHIRAHGTPFVPMQARTTPERENGSQRVEEPPQSFVAQFARSFL